MSDHRQVRRRQRPGGQGDDGQDESRRPLISESTDTSSTSENSAFIASQFIRRKPTLPVAKVALAFFLFAAGLASVGAFVLDQINEFNGLHVDLVTRKNENGEEYEVNPRHERFWPLLVLGFISILPGSYVSLIFVMAVLDLGGFTYDDIP